MINIICVTNLASKFYISVDPVSPGSCARGSIIEDLS